MQITNIPKDQIRLPGENYFNTMTPYFRYESILNEVQSQMQGREVRELKEVVEVRFAANPYYKPVFDTGAMYRMTEDGMTVITWAERFKEQYQAFLAGAPQEAEGTPLEELQPYGISPAQLSMCRAQSIYSIEALHHLDTNGAKRLGFHGNELRKMAARYMDARSDGSHAQSEINALKAQVAELMKGNIIPATAPTIEEAETSVKLADAEDHDAQKKLDIKEQIKALTGTAPRGNPSLDTLQTMLAEIKA